MKRSDPAFRKNLFPVLIDLSSKHVLVLTGPEPGEETLAVIEALIPCTDHLAVQVSSPDNILEQMAKKYSFALRIKPYEREDLYDADVVICALSSRDMMDEVFAACRTLGIRLSLLPAPGRSDFLPDPGRSSDEAALKDEAGRGAGGDEASESLSKSPYDASARHHKVVIYTDGAARGNPNGPGGYGAVIEYVDSKGQLHTKELSQGYIKTTNNRMELMGAVAAFEALTKPCEVELWSDSKYLVDAFRKHWIDGWIRKNWMRTQSEPVKNVDLWKRLLEASKPHTVSWNWLKGHDGHAQNERCDKLAVSAADGDDRIPDPGIGQ